jgi:hypothetical protein
MAFKPLKNRLEAGLLGVYRFPQNGAPTDEQGVVTRVTIPFIIFGIAGSFVIDLSAPCTLLNFSPGAMLFEHNPFNVIIHIDLPQF